LKVLLDYILLPPGDNPIAVNKYIIYLHICFTQAACSQYIAKLHKYFKCSCW